MRAPTKAKPLQRRESLQKWGLRFCGGGGVDLCMGCVVGVEVWYTTLLWTSLRI